MSTATDGEGWAGGDGTPIASGDRLFAWAVYGRDVFGRDARLTGWVTGPDTKTAGEVVAAGLAGRKAEMPGTVIGSAVFEAPAGMMAAVLRANGYAVTPPAGP